MASFETYGKTWFQGLWGEGLWEAVGGFRRGRPGHKKELTASFPQKLSEDRSRNKSALGAEKTDSSEATHQSYLRLSALSAS